MIRIRTALAAAVLVGVAGCASLQQLAALRNVRFDLGPVRGGSLAGVNLSQVADYSRLSAVDVGRVAVAVARKDLPLEFVLDLRADNPAENKVTARMVRLGWSLFLNDRETINGVIDTAVVIPPGQPATIPMRLRLNLFQFFDGSARDLVNLAASLAGASADPTKISLKGVPTIETPIGPMSYPTPVTIVSRTVGGSGR
ncbi:MAG: hypothetical protein AB7L66_11920 [Gemmatimonadales bacterium]